MRECEERGECGKGGRSFDLQALLLILPHPPLFPIFLVLAPVSCLLLQLTKI